jgi:hypothetical protein
MILLLEQLLYSGYYFFLQITAVPDLKIKDTNYIDSGRLPQFWAVSSIILFGSGSGSWQKLIFGSGSYPTVYKGKILTGTKVLTHVETIFFI